MVRLDHMKILLKLLLKYLLEFDVSQTPLRRLAHLSIYCIQRTRSNANIYYIVHIYRIDRVSANAAKNVKEIMPLFSHVLLLWTSIDAIHYVLYYVFTSDGFNQERGFNITIGIAASGNQIYFNG